MARRPTPIPTFPGYNGDVRSTQDFAKCGHERRFAIMERLTRLMALTQGSLEKSDARIAHASLAVERVEAEIADERAFLADLMAIYIDYSQVFAAEAAQAIEAGSAEVADAP